jgi:hypothetical protein
MPENKESETYADTLEQEIGRLVTHPGKNPGQAGAREEHQDPGKNIRDERSSQAGRTVSDGSRSTRRDTMKESWLGRLPLLACRVSPLRGVHPEL